jgi:hypothetical protein
MTDSKDDKDSKNKAVKGSGKSKKAAIKATRSEKEAKKQAGQPEARVPETGAAYPGGRAAQPPRA